MPTDNQRIATLYGEGSTTSDTPSSPVTDHAMYPSQPLKVGNPYALEPDSVENQLYGGTEINYLGSENEDLIEQLSNNDEKVKEIWISSLGHFASASGAVQDEIGLILREAVTARMVGAPDADERDTLTGLIDKYGHARAEKLLKDAKTLAASFPNIRRMLNDSGIGNSPAVIQLFIRLSQTSRGEYRLSEIKRGAK